MATTIARGFTHVQATPSTTWVIKHGDLMGRTAVEVFVTINGEDVKIFPKTVTTSNNTTTITFTAAYAGKAYVI